METFGCPGDRRSEDDLPMLSVSGEKQLSPERESHWRNIPDVVLFKFYRDKSPVTGLNTKWLIRGWLLAAYRSSLEIVKGGLSPDP